MSKNNLNYSVYVHTNKINGKKYVGQSSNIIERWKNGGKNYFSSTKFHRAIQKYGWENFTHEILSQLNPEIVEKQRQEQENKALREEINSLKEMFREFIKTSLKQEQHGNNN